MSDQFTNRFPAPTPAVLLFGEVLMDCFPDREVLGGAPFNVARHLRGFGLEPVLVTRVGDDLAGERVLRVMDGFGLCTHGVQRDREHATGRVDIQLDERGHRFDILPDQAYDHIDAELARQVAQSTRPAMVYFGTLALRAASQLALRELLLASRGHNFVDLNLRDPWVREDVLRWSLAQADTVKVNQEELMRIADLLALPDGAPQARAAAMIAAFELQAMLVTCGEQGAWRLDAEGRRDAVAGGAVADLVDSVGAGDAFAAVCMLGHLLDWPVAETLRRAHRFAADMCRRRGAIPEDDTVYAPFIQDWRIDGAGAPP